MKYNPKEGTFTLDREELGRAVLNFIAEHLGEVENPPTAEDVSSWDPWELAELRYRDCDDRTVGFGTVSCIVDFRHEQKRQADLKRYAKEREEYLKKSTKDQDK